MRELQGEVEETALSLEAFVQQNSKPNSVIFRGNWGLPRRKQKVRFVLIRRLTLTNPSRLKVWNYLTGP